MVRKPAHVIGLKSSLHKEMNINSKTLGLVAGDQFDLYPVAELSVGPGVAAALPQICHALHYPGWFTCHLSMAMQLIKAGSSDDSTVPHLAFYLSSTT